MQRFKRVQYAVILWSFAVATMVAASGFPSYVQYVDPAFSDLGCEGCHATGTPNAVVLRAKQVAPGQAPAIDGVEDPVWGGAPFVRVNLSGGFNPLAAPGEDGYSARGAPLPWATGNATSLTARALYTETELFMEFQWYDPTYSVQRQPWAFDAATGRWVSLSPIPYYEDKMSVIWEIGQVTGFSAGGCLVTCHATTLNRTAPLKYAPARGEYLDMWHWKLVRQNAVGQIDDQYVDYNTTGSTAGRQSDPNDNASRGYKNNAQTLNNTTANVSVPAYWIPGRTDYWWILQSEIDAHAAKRITSVDASNVLRDEDGTAVPSTAWIPGILTSPYTGDRGDISGRGEWSATAERWTLEVSRKLVTEHNGTLSPYDVQFTDLSKSYRFGVAVFDNTQIGHMWQPGPYRLVFGETPKPAPANLDVWGTSVAAAALMVSGVGALTLASAAAKGRARSPKAQDPKGGASDQVASKDPGGER